MHGVPTVSSVLLALCFLAGCRTVESVPPPAVADLSDRPFTFVEGAPVRGDVSKKQIALIFTGGEFGEGTGAILVALNERDIRASFFVTGAYLRQPTSPAHLHAMVTHGHYVGPHSDGHLLYCPWEDRSKTLVSQTEFAADLRKNIEDLREHGAIKDRTKPVYFIPPFEWYNADQTRWSRELGVLLFNFTPGSGSNRDYAPEGHKSFVPSSKIIGDILAYEKNDPHGLNGFLLLLHLGSARTDKVHSHIPGLLDELAKRGYTFVRVDQMLN